MRTRMWQLAAAAVLAISGAASAQTGVQVLPQIPVATQAAPAPMPAPAGAPAAAPATAPAVSPVIVHGQGGCTNCAAPAGNCASCDPFEKCKKSLLSRGVFGGAKIGAGCESPAGCGSFASERTFLFGSCKQFYNPGSDCGKHGGLGGGCGAGGCKNCGLIPPGPGGYGAPICTYGAYSNR